MSTKYSRGSWLGFLILLLAINNVWGYDLAETLKSGELWSLKRERHPMEDIYILDNDETSSRTASSKVTFASLPMGEVLLDWREPQQDENAETAEIEADENKTAKKLITPKANELYRVSAMVYTRGDDDSISMQEFNAKVKEVTALLTDTFSKRGKKGRLSGSKTGLKTDTQMWTCEHGVVRLETAYSTSKESGKRAELIRLVIATNSAELDRGGASDKIAKRDMKSNVVTEEDGTIWIKGIPMIDQEDKGYCLPATVARVFAYYGMDGVGMHELAALFNSEADGGTSVYVMKKTLKEIGGRFHVRIKELPGTSVNYFDIVPLYNKEAKKVGKPELLDPREAAAKGISWRQNIDPELWCKACTKKAGDVKKWMTPIRKSITAGVPVLWAVFASSMYTYPNAGIGEPHMRMIIGFNPKTNTVIYSDTWGKGTIKREMRMEEAYSVTDGTFVLQP